MLQSLVGPIPGGIVPVHFTLAVPGAAGVETVCDGGDDADVPTGENAISPASAAAHNPTNFSALARPIKITPRFDKFPVPCPPS